ncbi:MAG: DNA topoisomerase III [Rhizobium sp.]|nr:MAG: DNA topoisomerase III [Rhizobium sp.]
MTEKKKLNPALSKPMKPSADLAQIVGADPLPRSEVTKKLWAYIKQHNLQNAKDKRNIDADPALKKIFGADRVTMFEMTKLVNKHLS